MTLTDLAVGLAIAVGLIGVLFPVLPGALLVAGAIVVWALEAQTTTEWVVTGVALAALLVGQVVKYLVPGRKLKAHGIPNTTLLAGAVLGIVGFFVIPVVGIVVGFVLGVYLAEWARLKSHALAWPATKAALKQVGVSVLIEFAACLVAAMVWLAGAIAVG